MTMEFKQNQQTEFISQSSCVSIDNNKISKGIVHKMKNLVYLNIQKKHEVFKHHWNYFDVQEHDI